MTDKEKEEKAKAEAESKAQAEKEKAEAEAKAKAAAKGNASGDKLIEEACKAYGIDKKYVLASRVDKETGEAVIVTVGGKKVRYKAGDKVQPLGSIAITGVNPAAKRKPITGAKK